LALLPVGFSAILEGIKTLGGLIFNLNYGGDFLAIQQERQAPLIAVIGDHSEKFRILLLYSLPNRLVNISYSCYKCFL